MYYTLQNTSLLTWNQWLCLSHINCPFLAAGSTVGTKVCEYAFFIKQVSLASRVEYWYRVERRTLENDRVESARDYFSFPAWSVRNNMTPIYIWATGALPR